MYFKNRAGYSSLGGQLSKDMQNERTPAMRSQGKCVLGKEAQVQGLSQAGVWPVPRTGRPVLTGAWPTRGGGQTRLEKKAGARFAAALMHHAQAPGFYSKWNKESLAGSKQKHHVILHKLFSDCCVEGGCRGAKGKETIWEATLMAR